MKQNIKLILIVCGFLIIYLFIENYGQIKKQFKFAKWQKTDPVGKTENGLKQGRWTTEYISGNIAVVENYINDTLNGSRISYTPGGGFIVIENYRMGIRVDTFKSFSGGKLNNIEFRDSTGLLQGEFRIYVDDSLSQIGYYLNDKFHGNFLSYDYRTGKLKKIYSYVNGERSGKWIYLDTNGDTLKIESY